MNTNNTLVAVDVSKATLEIKTEHSTFSIPNTKESISKLIESIKPQKNPFVVCEATGGYERLMMNMLHRVEIPICRANAARIRAFARSEGVQIKTDSADALMIFRFAQEKNLRPTLPLEPARQKLASLLDRRHHLKDQTAKEKNRLQNSPDEIHESIKRMLNILKEEIEIIENQINETIRSSVKITAQVECLMQIKGVGKVTAWTVVAFLGEIDRLTRNQIVSLAGLAPFNRDSGTFKGKRKVIGGRGKVRAALYMATHTAAMHNPVIKQYVDGLLSRGKPYKCAIVAGMRKMLIHMQSELKNLKLEVAE